MNRCDGISSDAIDDTSSNQRVSLAGFSINISLIENSDLAEEIEIALTIESAEMVLLTLRRVDEVILVAPHMVPAWKKLLDRLVYLDPKSALKYVTEMSLHWNPRYAEVLIQEHQGKIFEESLQIFTRFIRGTQAVGNELDMYEMQIWGELIMEKLSGEGLPDIIASLLDNFPTSYFSKGYLRTPAGVSHDNFQSFINPDFCKKVAETLLLLIGEYMKESPLIVVVYTIPSAIRILQRGIDVDMIERFFISWKEGIGIIAEKDADCAMRIIKNGEDNPFIETHHMELERLKQDLCARCGISAVDPIDTLYSGWKGPFANVRDWKKAVDDNGRSQAINNWEKSILNTAEKDPESAINAIYESIEPYGIYILEDEGFIQTILKTFGSVMDMIFTLDPLRGLIFCNQILKEQSLFVTSFSRIYFFKKILEHIPCNEVSHPDLALSLYWHMDYALSRGSFETDYSVGSTLRHRKILENIIPAARINLLEAIRGCEHLLTFSTKDSEIYLEALSLWREYMRKLEKRHAETAGVIYSYFHATLRHKVGYEELASESDAGYERCLETKKLQACTSTPFMATSSITGNPGN